MSRTHERMLRFVVILCLAASVTLRSDAATLRLTSVPHPLSEEAKIEALLRALRDLKDATFIRIGRETSCPSAADFLRRRWKRGREEINTAREFIEELATRSPWNSEPYVIRFRDGTERPSGEFLKERLAELEKEGR